MNVAKQFDFEVTTPKDPTKQTLVANLVVDPIKFNIRWKMPPRERILRMVEDLRKHGQKQAIGCAVVDGKVTVVFGFCRAIAYAEVNRQERAEGVSETPITFRMVSKAEAADEMLRIEGAISENEVRFNPTPMDRAYAMRKLYSDFKWDQKKIAERFDVSQATVSNHLKLFELSESIQEEIHDGILSYSQALLLFKVPEEKRDEVVNEAKTQSAKLDPVPGGGNGKKGSEEPRINTGKLKDSAKSVARTEYAKNITDFKNFVMKEDKETPELSLPALKVLNALFDWFSGTLDEAKLKKVLEKNCLE